MARTNGDKKTARQVAHTRNIQPARNTLMLSVSMPLELIALMDQRCQAHVPPLKRSQYVCGLIINDLKSYGLINNKTKCLASNRLLLSASCEETTGRSYQPAQTP